MQSPLPPASGHGYRAGPVPLKPELSFSTADGLRAAVQALSYSSPGIAQRCCQAACCHAGPVPFVGGLPQRAPGLHT